MNLKSIFVYPRLPDSLARLQALACNLWCTWNYQAIRLFYRIDAPLFRAVHHNPILFLASLPGERIGQLAEDKGFLFELERVWEQFQQYMAYDDQFRTRHGGALAPRDRKSVV